MSKINILNESVFNKIAAGEVVEKPASVVKELLDNAIDAGSTKISVNITEGGIKNITISDNGSGIEPDDFSKVFAPHATSKVKTSEDLEKIGTLGFRGEALASIASVSKILLTSKISSETFGRSCEIEGGNQGEVLEVGCEDGTTLSVSDLFFNVPARAKFLRKPKSEMSDITNLVERYILANPTIAFTYIADGKTIIQSTGTNLFDAIYVVYGNQTTQNIVKVDYLNKNSGIGITGYIGLPTFSKPNRTYQTLIVNGRYIASAMVSTCISNAYEHFLMKGQFPFYVLNLTIPLDKLDVNVHPNKMEVRFGNSNEIYGNVYGAITKALLDCEKITTVADTVTKYKNVATGVSFVDEAQDEKPKVVEILSENKTLHSIDVTTLPIKKVEEQKVVENQEISNKNSTMQSEFLNKMVFGNSSFENGILKEPSSPIMSSIIQENHKQSMIYEGLSDVTKNRTEEFFDTSDIKFVGEIFATYLIVEKQEKVYIIDQHAGHERLLFDRLVKEVDTQNVTKQSLLIPHQLNVNRQEFEFLDENLDNLKKLGFDIEEFGNLSFMVSTIPSLLSGINLNSFFNGILKDLNVFKNLKQSDLILNKLMQHSCKTAVRAGKILSSGEVNSLISQFKEESMQLQCPHGRPVIVELNKKDIEKWFKRIV